MRIRRIDKTLALPQYNETDPTTSKQYDRSMIAGLDLSCRVTTTIAPGELGIVPLNIAIEIPPDYFVLLCARSSVPWKKQLMLANGIEVVDPFFNGDADELKAQFYNFSAKPVTIERGECLVQALLLKREAIDWNEVSTMGRDGHGGYKTNLEA